MNEQIKVLIAQATTRIDPIAHDGACWDFDKEKFAQLIVQDCIRQVYPDNFKLDGVEPSNLADAVSRIKQHFGVEE